MGYMNERKPLFYSDFLQKTDPYTKCLGELTSGKP